MYATLTWPPCLCLFISSYSHKKSNFSFHGRSNELVLPSKLDFHIWITSSQLFSRAKTEAKMAAHGRKFCTSLSVLFAILYVSFTPLHDFNLQFLFGSASKTFLTMEKVFRRNITELILHNRVFKRIHYCRLA